MVAGKWKGIILVLLMVSLTLAGCTDKGSLRGADPTSGTTQDDPTGTGHAAEGPRVKDALDEARRSIDPNETAAAPWYLFTLKTGPDGAAVGHSIPVPDDARHQTGGSTRARPIVEVVPVVAPGLEPQVRSWGVMAFVGDDAATPGATMLQLTANRSDGQTETRVQPTLDPMLWDTAHNTSNLSPATRYTVVLPGEDLTFVFAAALAVEGEIGLALRFLPDGLPDAPSSDLAAFLRAVGKNDPQTPEHLGQTRGFTVAETYLSSVLDTALGRGPLWSLYTTPNIEVTAGALTTAHTGIIDLTLSSDARTDNGTTIASASFQAFYHAIGMWSVQADIHDLRWDEWGIVALSGTVYMGDPLDLGGFTYDVAHEGEGTSGFSIQITGMNLVLTNGLDLRHIVFGAPMEDLIGIPLEKLERAPGGVPV